MNDHPDKTVLSETVIALEFSDTLVEVVPTLKIEIKSNGRGYLKYSNDPLCFIAEHFLVEIKDGPMKTPKLRGCPKNQGNDSISDKTKQSLEIPFDQLFDSTTEWPKGTYFVDFFWKDRSQNVVVNLKKMKWTKAQPLQTVTLKKGQQIDLVDGSALKFYSHGHKEVMTADEESPLILFLNFKEPKSNQFSECNINLFFNLTKTFLIKEKYFFKLLDYDYDRSMTFVYYGNP